MGSGADCLAHSYAPMGFSMASSSSPAVDGRSELALRRAAPVATAPSSSPLTPSSATAPNSVEAPSLGVNYSDREDWGVGYQRAESGPIPARCVALPESKGKGSTRPRPELVRQVPQNVWRTRCSGAGGSARSSAPTCSSNGFARISTSLSNGPKSSRDVAAWMASSMRWFRGMNAGFTARMIEAFGRRACQRFAHSWNAPGSPNIAAQRSSPAGPSAASQRRRKKSV